jgi:hypothetical protein
LNYQKLALEIAELDKCDAYRYLVSVYFEYDEHDYDKEIWDLCDTSALDLIYENARQITGQDLRELHQKLQATAKLLGNKSYK